MVKDYNTSFFFPPINSPITCIIIFFFIFLYFFPYYSSSFCPKKTLKITLYLQFCPFTIQSLYLSFSHYYPFSQFSFVLASSLFPPLFSLSKFPSLSVALIL